MLGHADGLRAAHNYLVVVIRAIKAGKLPNSRGKTPTQALIESLVDESGNAVGKYSSYRAKLMRAGRRLDATGKVAGPDRAGKELEAYRRAGYANGWV